MFNWSKRISLSLLIIANLSVRSVDGRIFNKDFDSKIKSLNIIVTGKEIHQTFLVCNKSSRVKIELL